MFKKSKIKDSINSSFLLKFLIALLAINIIAVLFFVAATYFKLSTVVAYLSPREGELLILLADDCPDCGKMQEEKDLLAQNNFKFNSEKHLQRKDEDFQKMVKKFEIKNLPALIFISERKFLDKDANFLGEKGAKLFDDAGVFQKKSAPFFDLKSSTVFGKMKITYISLAGCEGCLDFDDLKKGLMASFKMYFGEEKNLDYLSVEAQKIIEQYEIKTLPTLVIEGQGNFYPKFEEIWSSVGDKDGNLYILRKPENISSRFYDLKLKKFMKVEKKESS